MVQPLLGEGEYGPVIRLHADTFIKDDLLELTGVLIKLGVEGTESFNGDPEGSGFRTGHLQQKAKINPKMFTKERGKIKVEQKDGT